MRKTETREIGGMTFAVTQIPGTRGTRLSYKLARTVLPALVKAAKGLDGLDLTKGLSLAKLDLGSLLANVGEGVDVLFANLPPEEFEKLWKELFEFVQVTVNERTCSLLPVFDEILAGQQVAFFKLLTFALEVNFQDFFQELAAKAQAQAARELLSSASASSRTSGPVGA